MMKSRLHRRARYVAIVAPVMLIAGCAASTQITEVNPGVYAVNVGAMGIEGGETAARNKALAAASSYCAAQGRKLSVQSQQSRGPVEWGSAAGSASVTFACLSGVTS
jgi:putative hemolysin